MRVSDNMTNEMAKRAGLPINMRGAGESTKNTLLEALDNKKIEDDYFTDSAVDTKKMKEGYLLAIVRRTGPGDIAISAEH